MGRAEEEDFGMDYMTSSDDEEFEVKPVVRHKVPQVIGIQGKQFSGKTFSALMLAAGLVKPGGKIGVIDTENGRLSQYADDPDVMRLIPQGLIGIELNPPYHPKRYVGAYKALLRAGADLAIVDSGSHAWEGEGGALDIKEKDRGWANAKKWSKRYKNTLIYSPIDVIICLRAAEKVRVEGEGKKQKYIPIGEHPICEKNLPYDLSVQFSVAGEIDGQPATHFATPKKWQKGLGWLFNTWQPQYLTPEIGRKIREWNDSGSALPAGDRIKKQAQAAAANGMDDYQEFFKSLSLADRKMLIESGAHEENKRMAKTADDEMNAAEDGDSESVITDRWAAMQAAHGERFTATLHEFGFKSVDAIPLENRQTVYDALVARLGDVVAA